MLRHLFLNTNIVKQTFANLDIFGCICEGLSRTYASYAKF